MESVDLLYVHWPTDAYDPGDTLPAFDEVRDRGWTDHVGVSNFDRDLLADAQEVLDAPIVANQIEMHPLLPPTGAMLSYCANHDVAPVAYSPLCRGDALELDEVVAVAEKHDLSPARVLIAWLADQSVPVVTKASGTDHIEDTLAGLDLELDDEDRARIDGVERRYRRFDRDGSPWN
ncbi:aldo/keto reductase [Halococcus hamelinensis 100A6]|uniref:Aldo/keto reductase n=1 Tax=Halococcus hamelinensis 100A6 TaxID=1132509 RepID=M0M298_9EURY|nr:aldo/keto reductase [Halococcus hamelinensis 100A6]